MKIYQFIERHFWIFLISGLVMGLSFPVYNEFLMSLLKPLLMVMLFLVFLKTDIAQIFKKMKNYRLITSVVFLNMLAIPMIFYLIINFFDHNLAIGVLLLTAMPAGISTPAFTDIVKGNIALSASLVIATSMIAPLTVPLLFGIVDVENLAVNPWWLFKDLAMIIFVPMVTSQLLKSRASRFIERKRHLFTCVNIIIVSLLVYIVMGSQRTAIFKDFITILWQTGFLYLIFILLHVFGFIMGFTEDRKGKIATAVGAAYMNNGMAIVLAGMYFEPSVVVLVVLSELPWNTLLIPFRKFIRLREKRYDSEYIDKPAKKNVLLR